MSCAVWRGKTWLSREEWTCAEGVFWRERLEVGTGGRVKDPFYSFSPKGRLFLISDGMEVHHDFLHYQ